MKKLNVILGVLFVSMLLFSSCKSLNHSMREPNNRIEFVKSDFTYSGQVTGEATSTKILSIDWSRLFYSEKANIDGTVSSISIANLPVIGNYIGDKTSNYALYDMMKKNEGYDIILYPQYEITVEKPIGIGFLFKKTTVKATARLGKLN